jgi:hypothetical protein
MSNIGKPLREFDVTWEDDEVPAAPKPQPVEEPVPA